MKNRFVSEFLNRFYGYYASANQTDYVEQYRDRSFVIGRQVSIMPAGKFNTALAIGIDDECRLLVRYPDGTEDRFSSGEISIRI